MPKVTYKSISPAEALFLFRMMEESKSFAIMEFHITDPGEPQPYDFSESLFSTPYGAVRTEVVDETIVVYVGEMEIGFDISEVTFSRHISDFRIEVWASTELYTATFESGDMEDEYLDKARAYEITEDVPYPEYSGILLEVDEHEAALIRFLRTLDFDDLMDATDGIRREADATRMKGIRAERKRTGSALNVKGFMDRAERLKKLEVVLGWANKDYRSMVDPDGEDKAHE
ncbi:MULTISPECIES: hypothetical protein [Paenibacillus]|uniref:hypothetical protein n=1 Tax=Paenibacillus TaxID=44249 RepID=UPI00096E2230|nr:hypothetical protein [Paenibacillus odorifer]OMD06453.1 hypothetical protein BJP50_11085 [Paenibacillus odorifer]